MFGVNRPWMYILGSRGAPIPERDVLKWGEWMQTHSRRVAETYVGKVWVSTVFLGLDHGWTGPPILYETMIFGGKLDRKQFRYCTRRAAVLGHRVAVTMVERVRPSKGMRKHVRRVKAPPS